MTLNTRKNLAIQVLPPGGANPLTMRLQMRRTVQVGAAIGLIIGALVGDGGTPGYAYTIIGGALPTNTILNGDGTIQVNGALVAGEKAIFLAEVQDSASNVFDATFQIDIGHLLQPVAVTPTPIEDSLLMAYSYTFKVKGNVGAVTWAVTSGSLPPALSLSAGGVLSGTPAGVAGTTYNFEVTATDAGAPFDSLPIPVSMTGLTAVDIDATNLTNTYVKGTYYPRIPMPQPADAPRALNGVPPYKFTYSQTSGPSQSWVVYNKAGDGFMSGTPDAATVPGTPIIINTVVTDAAGVQNNLSTEINVVEPNQKLQPKRLNSDVGNAGPQNIDYTGIGASKVTNDGNTVRITLGATMNKPNISCTIPADTTAVLYGTLTRASGVFITREAGAFLVVM